MLELRRMSIKVRALDGKQVRIRGEFWNDVDI
jgi:hypothetical protein